MTFYKSGHQKRKLAKKDESLVRKLKVMMLEAKFKSNVHGLTEGTDDRGDVKTTGMQETLHMQLKEHSEGKHTNKVREVV